MQEVYLLFVIYPIYKINKDNNDKKKYIKKKYDAKTSKFELLYI